MKKSKLNLVVLGATLLGAAIIFIPLKKKKDNLTNLPKDEEVLHQFI